MGRRSRQACKRPRREEAARMPVGELAAACGDKTGKLPHRLSGGPYRSRLSPHGKSNLLDIPWK
ncbi:hypothetical protein BO78DRAFT_52022 [Aspergillus sclerotiicarbonarius CBS 121057]|uniref:Uncharacterized protein n=1 Tax=Aspergillus sclerotiicarbonarius (strain CBS 121057 / IBT 28362) TaxID=1448318 RepID=A0A319F1L7_ASPSB|nr:hypothetical protein BO78DRAFT_52022 [Aspergillus sclerotiicarbonarius CBS 121057]